MAAPLYPPKNVGPITYAYNGKTSTVSWPYFTHDSKGRNALQRQALPLEIYSRAYGSSGAVGGGRGGFQELNAIGIAQAIQDALNKFDNDAVKKAAADRKAVTDAAYAAMVARNYAQTNAPTTVISVSNPIPPSTKLFTTNTLKSATTVVVATARKNSKKAIKVAPKPPNKPKLPSPKKPTPNKNPTIPPPPPPPPPSPPLFPSDPDKTMQRPCPICIASLDPNNKSYCPPCEPCSPGWYVGPEGECLKCAFKVYIKGSKCAPCPPGTTGESIHTGCKSFGPNGEVSIMIA